MDYDYDFHKFALIDIFVISLVSGSWGFGYWFQIHKLIQFNIFQIHKFQILVHTLCFIQYTIYNLQL